MGFFKEFKDDLSEVANGVPDIASEDDVMVNTLDNGRVTDRTDEAESIDNAMAAMLSADNENGESTLPDDIEEGEYADDGEMPVDETAIITAGLKVNGDFDSVGSIDVFGTITGNVRCRGKLTVSGSIIGDADTGELFANNAKIDGNIKARGAVKVGQGTVIVGNVTGMSAVIAGAIKGDVDVRGPVIIDSSAVIVGDIKSKTVQINNGATINGRCTQCYSDVDVESIFNI